MKLLQLNAWSNKLSPKIIDLLAEEKSDIVCFQEVIQAEFGGKILDGTDEIFTAHPFKDYFYSPLVEFSFMHHRAQRGNLIAANTAIIDRHTTWTNGQYVEDFDYVDSGGYNAARNFIHATLNISGIKSHVITYHGYHIAEHKNGDALTERACQQIVDYCKSLTGPVIITGDFNLVPDSQSIQLVNRYFRNLSAEFELATTRNTLTSKTEVCDYIFTNKNVIVNDFYMSDIVASDHNALVLDFDIIE